MIVQRMFSSKSDKENSKDDKKNIPLSVINSDRGLGRSIIWGGLPGAISAYAGKSAARKADEEGKSDEEIIKAAEKAGAKRGAILGTARGIGHGYLTTRVVNKLLKNGVKDYTPAKYGKYGKISGITAGTLLGAGTYFGGKFGARKNAQKRVETRQQLANKK